MKLRCAINFTKIRVITKGIFFKKYYIIMSCSSNRNFVYGPFDSKKEAEIERDNIITSTLFYTDDDRKHFDDYYFD